MIQGTIAEQYGKLWDYYADLMCMNSGFMMKVKCAMNEVYPNPKFQRIYMCLQGLKEGWLAGCRKIIGLDGCFIKGHHTGQLLIAIGVDPNNHMYPIAYAIVEFETRDSWTWFLEFIGADSCLDNSHGLSWISDKHKGFVDTIAEMFPHSQHRHCMKHLHNNFKVHYKGLLLKQALWAATKSNSEPR